MLALAEWVRASCCWNPQPELMTKVDPIFRAHIFFGMTVFLVFPFTRLVHPDRAVQLPDARLPDRPDQAPPGLRLKRG